MIKIEKIQEQLLHEQTFINGHWVIARPIRYQGCFLNRLNDAWLVLIDKADALVWPEGQ